MSKTLSINGKVIEYPSPNQEPGWGSPATDFAEEVAETLDSIAGVGTILETQAIIENSVLEAAKKSVPGLVFNFNFTKTATISYRISRKTTMTGETVETGTLDVFYTPNDPSNKWQITRTILSGDPTLTYFDIDNIGQVKYWATIRLTNPMDSNYVGLIRFKTVSNVK